MATKAEIIEVLKQNNVFMWDFREKFLDALKANLDVLFLMAEHEADDAGIELHTLYEIALESTLKEYSTQCPECEEYFLDLTIHDDEAMFDYWCDPCVQKYKDTPVCGMTLSKIERVEGM